MTTEGKEWMTDKLQSLAGNSNATANVITWGTGITAEAVGNTFGSAFTESAEGRTTGTLSQPTSTTDRVVGTVTATGTRSITEVARTNHATVSGSGQIMYIRATFTAVPVVTGDGIAFTIDMVMS